MRLLLLICLHYIFLSLNSCGSHNSTQSKAINYDSLREPLVNANKLSVTRESDEIDQYVKFNKWEMIVTGTGIRYQVYKNGTGDLAKNGQLVKLNYKVSLLDGTLCYSSDTKGPKQFMIGQDNVESGLHEVVCYLKVGDKAIVILPSHLAFGLTGDNNKIPPRATVRYDIELLSLK